MRSLGSELAALKEDGGGDGGGAAGRRVSLMSLAAMEKIQVRQRGRGRGVVEEGGEGGGEGRPGGTYPSCLLQPWSKYRS